jgi:hypothetical protein
VDADDEAVQQEIFGPVLCVQPFDDADQALALPVSLRPGRAGTGARPSPGPGDGPATLPRSRGRPLRSGPAP